MLSKFLPSYDRIKNIKVLKIVTVLHIVTHFYRTTFEDTKMHRTRTIREST